MRILGVDPGSRLTGYGCIDLVGNQLRHVSHGTLKLASVHGKATVPLEQRLLLLYQGLSEAIQKYRPQVLAVEKVFFAKNAVSALKLGQARGAVVLTGAIHGLEIVEYSPTEVKASLSGYGRADKDQVAKMVQIIVGKKDFETSDASDGVALAICHAYRVVGGRNVQGVGSGSAGSLPTKKRGRSLAESLGLRLGPKGEVERS